jgi:glyoxylase-like metal-dependent hydrolase (beta-lactamase superfamily II)
VPRVSQGHTLEIAPGVMSLSNAVSLVKSLSWVEPGAKGFDPSNCYLLLSAGAALLVDTGLRVHRDSLLDQIAAFVSSQTPLAIALTRVEPDCLGNLIEIAERFNVIRVSSQSNVIPFDYLGPFSGRFPGVEIVNGLHPGDKVPVGPDRSLVVVEPVVRTLPTLWFFDAMTGTLFCSDFFGEDRLQKPDDWGEHPVTAATARDHMLAKFDWIAIADTSTAISRLDSLFDNFPVEVLAPGHGLWTKGAAAVRERYGLVRRALEASLSTRSVT